MSNTIIVVSGMAFEAKLARGQGIDTIYGLDPAKFLADIETAIHNGALGILSFGTAAGLSPSLATGSIVIAKQIYAQQQVFSADTHWVNQLSGQLPDAHIADIAGVDYPIASSEEKSLLYKNTGAATADMESHLVARIAEQYKVPFAVLRVVLDDADCTLPPAALASTKANGTINYGGLIGSLIAKPAQLPALLQLGRDHAKAKEALTRCSHLLGSNRFGFDLR